MPDEWERRYLTSSLSMSFMDSKTDTDGDGYTDLEEYLNGSDPLE
jgi:hypothetical protein